MVKHHLGVILWRVNCEFLMLLFDISKSKFNSNVSSVHDIVWDIVPTVTHFCFRLPGARMWTPFKELHHTVEAAVLRKQPDAIQDLEKILKKHKPDFLSLLQNPVSVIAMNLKCSLGYNNGFVVPESFVKSLFFRLQAKNKVHREAVKNADKTGIAILGQQATQTLSKDFIDEALIISDLFDLNEYAAVELLLAGVFPLSRIFVVATKVKFVYFPKRKPLCPANLTDGYEHL